MDEAQYPAELLFEWKRRAIEHAEELLLRRPSEASGRIRYYKVQSTIANDPIAEIAARARRGVGLSVVLMFCLAFVGLDVLGIVDVEFLDWESGLVVALLIGLAGWAVSRRWGRAIQLRRTCVEPYRRYPLGDSEFVERGDDSYTTYRIEAKCGLCEAGIVHTEPAPYREREVHSRVGICDQHGRQHTYTVEGMIGRAKEFDWRPPRRIQLGSGQEIEI